MLPRPAARWAEPPRTTAPIATATRPPRRRLRTTARRPGSDPIAALRPAFANGKLDIDLLPEVPRLGTRSLRLRVTHRRGSTAWSRPQPNNRVPSWLGRIVRVTGFDDWYREERPKVVASVTAITGRSTIASDSADEAFTRAVERWRRVSQMSSPAGWVHQTALNVARRTLRREAHEHVCSGPTRRAEPRMSPHRPSGTWTSGTDCGPSPAVNSRRSFCDTSPTSQSSKWPRS
ncbi:MAG: sigma factor [Acidimicrobiales bacterium]